MSRLLVYMYLGNTHLHAIQSSQTPFNPPEWNFPEKRQTQCSFVFWTVKHRLFSSKYVKLLAVLEICVGVFFIVLG